MASKPIVNPSLKTGQAISSQLATSPRQKRPMPRPTGSRPSCASGTKKRFSTSAPVTTALPPQLLFQALAAPRRRPFWKTFSPPQPIRQSCLYGATCYFSFSQVLPLFMGGQISPPATLTGVTRTRPTRRPVFAFGCYIRQINLKRQRGEIIGRSADDRNHLKHFPARSFRNGLKQKMRRAFLRFSPRRSPSLRKAPGRCACKPESRPRT